MCLSLAEHPDSSKDGVFLQAEEEGRGGAEISDAHHTLFPFSIYHETRRVLPCSAQHHGSHPQSQVRIQGICGSVTVSPPTTESTFVCTCFYVCRCGSVVDSSPSMHGAMSSIRSSAEMSFNSISMHACFHRYFSEVGPLGQSFRYISQRASKTAQEVKVCLGFLLL